MLRIMFWNAGRAPLDAIAQIAESERVDILALAEPAHTLTSYLLALNGRNDRPPFLASPSHCRRISLYARLPGESLSTVSDSQHMTIRLITLPIGAPFLLVCAHLRSKLYQDTESQKASLFPVAQEIRSAEVRAGLDRTVLVGDLNADPYETALVAALGFHGVMTRERAERGDRVVEGRRYPFFYNPMWSFFGDLSAGPPGTYHYARAEQVVPFWHCFDQVLLRPAMLEHFRQDSIRIVTRTKTLNLADEAGYPNAAEFSDHFPIVLALHI